MWSSWVNTQFLDNSLQQWLSAIGLAAAIVLALILVKRVLLTRLAKHARNTETRVDDALIDVSGSTRVLLVGLVALTVGARLLELPERTGEVLDGIATVAIALQLGLWLSAAARFWFSNARSRAVASNAGAATSLAAMAFIAQTVLWTIVVLLAMDNLGINITALVAGLGIGGIAIALAVQNILGDLFASLSIVIDKPFVIGDFIVVDDYMGTVEYVGLKTTRVRSLGGEQIIFPNGDLLKARTRNFKRMIERRVVFSIGVVYDTPPDRLEKLPEMIRSIIEAQPKTRFDRAHLAKLGTSSLDYEIVYWFTDADFNQYMDVQQSINLGLLRSFSRAGIEIAFPTQVVQLVRAASARDDAGEAEEGHVSQTRPRASDKGVARQ